MANSNYMDLAIGNAPWPIGVTMVGIHERSGRAKIFTSQIARKCLKLNLYRYYERRSSEVIRPEFQKIDHIFSEK